MLCKTTEQIQHICLYSDVSEWYTDNCGARLWGQRQHGQKLIIGQRQEGQGHRTKTKWLHKKHDKVATQSQMRQTATMTKGSKDKVRNLF